VEPGEGRVLTVLVDATSVPMVMVPGVMPAVNRESRAQDAVGIICFVEAPTEPAAAPNDSPWSAADPDRDAGGRGVARHAGAEA
jgi:hypothetical protein